MQRVVYSTCSVHRRENEDVVAHALAAARAGSWRLEKVLPTWTRRGLAGTALSGEEGERGWVEAGVGVSGRRAVRLEREPRGWR